MFGSGKPQFNTAQAYSEYVKEQERQQQILDAKERQQQQYNADMQQLAQDALAQAKKSNEIAKENKVLAEKSVKIASESKLLSVIATLVALAAIGVSVVLHFC